MRRAFPKRLPATIKPAPVFTGDELLKIEKGDLTLAFAAPMHPLPDRRPPLRFGPLHVATALEMVALEGPFMDAVAAKARAYRWIAYHAEKAPARARAGKWKKGDFVTPYRYDGKGFPDLVLVHPLDGSLLVFEAKRVGEAPTPAQVNWCATFNAGRRPCAYIVDASHWPYIDALLRAPFRGASNA